MIVNYHDTVNEVPNAYTYYLEEKLGKLYSQMVNKNVSVEDMKKNVYNYVWNAGYSFKKDGKIVYTKKKWFLETLRELESKKQIYFFCRNSVRRARETEARR